MAIHHGNGLIGGALVIALLALLIHWIGINTIEHYRDDLLFYLQAHLILVLASMLAALTQESIAEYLSSGKSRGGKTSIVSSADMALI